MTRRNFPKLRLAIALLIATLSLPLVVWSQRQDKPAPQNATIGQTIPIRAIVVEKSTSAQRTALNASGTLEPIRSATLAFAVGGVVDRLRVRAGERVASGQVLASLDGVPFRAAVDQTEAQLLFLENRYERSLELSSSGAIALEELDADASQKQSARAALDLAKWNLQRSSLRAPFAGSIDERYVESGEVVAPGSPAFRLINTDSLEVEVSLPARDLGRIGSTARVSSGEDPRVEVPAVLAHRPVAADARSSSVPVLLRLANENGRFLPGTVVSVRFDSKKDVGSADSAGADDAADSYHAVDAVDANASSGHGVRVPLSAIRTTTSGPVVFHIREGRAVATKVRPQEVREHFAWVVEGVKPGDRLVLEPPDRLRDGDAVAVVEEN